VLSKLARSALDLVFPIHCTGCGREGGIICGQCAGNMEQVTHPRCDICFAPGANGVCHWCLQFPRGFESLQSPYRFEGPIRDAVHALKYRGVRAAADSLGGLMAEYLQTSTVNADVLVPVPLHPRRLRNRGYNQSALLARAISRRNALPMLDGHLVRIRNSRPQVEVTSREERRRNIADNFDCPRDASGLAMLLIDDVATTGSTLSECAYALKNAGASTVHALTLARDA